MIHIEKVGDNDFWKFLYEHNEYKFASSESTPLDE